MKKFLEKLLFVAVIGMAMFMDFAIGVLIVSVVSIVQGIDVSAWQLVVGGILALLPDFDLIVPLLRRKYEGLDEHHTTLMHRPLFLLPVATLVAWWFGGSFWSAVTFLCVLWHFIHDTKGFGDNGLEWLWPFSKKEWFFFGSEDPGPKPGLEEWLETKWLVPSGRSFGEMAIGCAAFGSGTGLIYGGTIGALLAMTCALGTIAVWVAHRFVRS